MENIEHAVIQIWDYNEQNGKQKQDSANIPDTTSDNTLADQAGALKKSKTGKPALNVTDIASARLAKGVTGEQKEGAEKKATIAKKNYQVQFNPSALEFEVTSVRPEAKQNNTEDCENKTDPPNEIEQSILEVSIKLTVKLIFDQVDVQDSFMWEKFRMKPSDVAGGLIKLYKKTEYSVQKEVEGFLAALRDNRTRKISFIWGDIDYTGILCSVDANYTMFSVSGRPVRADLTLTIDCINEGATNKSLGVWDNYYLAVFSGADSLDLERNRLDAGNLIQWNY